MQAGGESEEGTGSEVFAQVLPCAVGPPSPSPSLTRDPRPRHTQRETHA